MAPEAKYTSQIKIILATAMSSAMILPTSLVNAQEGANLMLEEIVVTSQKREQSMQEAPLAITAITAEGLELRGVVNIGDMAKYTPNLVVSENPGSGNSSSIFSIRGATTNDILISADNAVAVYVDGVVASKSVGSNFDLAEIERIEVLRGPQGTLFGKNSVGGAISVISKKPTGEFGLEATLSGGSDNLKGGKFHLNLPAAGEVGEGMGSLAIKVSGLIRERDGLFGSTEGIEDGFNNVDRNGVRFSSRWELNESFSVDYIYDRSKATENQTQFQITEGAALGSIASFAAAAPFASSERLDSVSGSPLALMNDGTPFQDGLYSNSKNSGHNVTANFSLNENLEIKYIFGKRETEVSNAIDLDATPLPIAHFTLDYDLSQESHEIQLLGSNESETLHYVFGAYKFEENGYEDALQHLFLGSQENTSHLAIDNAGEALYGQVDWTPIDKLTVTLGLRLSKDDREATKDMQTTAVLQAASMHCDVGEGQNPCVFFDAAPGMAELVNSNPALQGAYVIGNPTPSIILPGGDGVCTSFAPGMPLWFDHPLFGTVPTGSTVPGIPCLGISSFNATHSLKDQNIDRTFLARNLTLQYQWTEDMNTYMRYATGFRSPGFNGRAGVASSFAKPYERQETSSIELGLKATAMEGRVRYNAAIFREKSKNGLRTLFVPETASNQVFNAASAKKWGVEAEFTVAATENLTLNFAYGYLNVSQTTDLEAIEALGLTPPANLDDVNVHAPKHTGSAGLQWDQDLKNGSLTARVDWSYKSKEYMTPSLVADIFAQKAYSTMDARISWRNIEIGRGQFDLSVWGKNITDTKYRTMGVDFQLFQGNNYGAPRTWGMDLTTRF